MRKIIDFLKKTASGTPARSRSTRVASPRSWMALPASSSRWMRTSRTRRPEASSTPPPLAQGPLGEHAAGLQSVVDRCLEKETGLRYPSAGEVREYASSEHVRRGFCAQCGSALSFRDTRYPQYYTLTIASLDQPNAVRPTRHLFTDSRLEWFDPNDDCPRFPRGPGR